MDAKPHRPIRPLRVNDENMPPPNVHAPAGKTLHQRTKSTSALGAAAAMNNKKVLGETNANLRVAPKDDSEIGKTSPGKMKTIQEQAATATFQRPAVRPLGQKSSSSQNTIAGSKASAAVQPADSQLPKKIIPKKSKILKDTLAQRDVESKDSAVSLPAQATAGQVPQLAQPPATSVPVSAAHAVQHQEVVRTESVPLRGESGPRVQAPQSVAANMPSSQAVATVPVPQNNYIYQGGLALAAVQQQHLLPLAMPNSGPYQMATPPAEQDELEEDFDDADQDYMTANSFDLRTDATLTTILNPQPTKKQRAEIEEARLYVEEHRTPDDIEDEQWDTSMVAEYGDEIFEYMREMETRMSPNPHYMDQQQEIQWSMRGVLMDWVVQVHQRFNLLPETLFLTVNYIDRFLSCKIVSLGKLQLVGATAIFVAAKYEEVNCPTISEIIYMVDNGYTSDELLKAERFMLSMLQFELGWPGPMSFLRRISKADDYDLETRTLAKYFLEVTIMDERFVGCKPSFLAAGAHCMARLMLRKGDWTKAHVYYSNYTHRQLHRLLGAMLECCADPHVHHGAVYDKYTDKRYKRASTFVKNEVLRGFQLPFSCRSSFTTQQTMTGPWLGQ
ncbi:G2 mitotic-specific cyclin-4 [Lecanosticta acicola]|uniref:G2 mitotic-specific cyclin-4 n=1 Tax=Lecanosticta acicola TaxID=111012 RepID=A0AAI9E814_9PEZI|nr:G2 mitotic-specific cyclin-4 [Lecanosticta acicola]